MKKKLNQYDARLQEYKERKSPISIINKEFVFKENKIEELNIIIKSDVHGSSEAIKMQYLI